MSDKKKKVNVDVLLATLNGEEFIEDFLRSLATQKLVEINLLVSDDGSVDKTIEIIEKYSNKFERVKVIAGPRSGPSANFFSLMKHSTADFIALADQDDIWLPNHLSDSISQLELEASPAMTFSSSINFGDKTIPQVWPKVNSITMQRVIFQNYARGCTVVLNKELLKMITGRIPKKAVMHDWWILLVAMSCGTVKFLNRPQVLYRIHDRNTIGLGSHSKSIQRYLLYIKMKEWPIQSQLSELLTIYSQEMLQEQLEKIKFIQSRLNGKLRTRLRWAFFEWETYRERKMDDIKLKCIVIISPLLFKGTSKSKCLDGVKP